MTLQNEQKPRGLVAPLSQAQLGSLRDLAGGTLSTVPDDHRLRLVHLELIEDTPEGLVVTELGRQRLIADR